MLDVAKQGEVSRLYTGQSYPAGTQVSFRYFISERSRAVFPACVKCRITERPIIVFAL